MLGKLNFDEREHAQIGFCFRGYILAHWSQSIINLCSLSGRMEAIASEQFAALRQNAVRLLMES